MSQCIVAGDAAAARADVSLLTNFAPGKEAHAVADHTLKTIPLAFNMFETYLGCRFPYKALQTVCQCLFPLILSTGCITRVT